MGNIPVTFTEVNEKYLYNRLDCKSIYDPFMPYQPTRDHYCVYLASRAFNFTSFNQFQLDPNYTHTLYTHCGGVKEGKTVIRYYKENIRGSPRKAFTIEFFLPVTIVIIPDVLVTNITKLYQSCLVVMTCQTMLAGMKLSMSGTQNSHEVVHNNCLRDMS